MILLHDVNVYSIIICGWKQSAKPQDNNDVESQTHCTAAYKIATLMSVVIEGIFSEEGDCWCVYVWGQGLNSISGNWYLIGENLQYAFIPGNRCTRICGR